MPKLNKPIIDLATPTQVKNFLVERGLSPRKFLGQHFLVDKNILKKIIETAEIKEGEKVLEIGSGIGTLTLALACEGADVVTIEKDEGAVWPKSGMRLWGLARGFPGESTAHGAVMRAPQELGHRLFTC